MCAANWPGGSVTCERCQVPVFEQEALLHGGDEARLTRIEVKPSAVADVIEVFGDSAVPGAGGNPWIPQRVCCSPIRVQVG